MYILSSESISQILPPSICDPPANNVQYVLALCFLQFSRKTLKVSGSQLMTKHFNLLESNTKNINNELQSIVYSSVRQSINSTIHSFVIVNSRFLQRPQSEVERTS